MKRKLHECPVCTGSLVVAEYRCQGCDTVIRGSFPQLSGNLGALSRDDQKFIEHFVRSRGSIKEMEKLLGVSYPTVRGMLNRVIENMGYRPGESGIGADERKEILQRLEDGEITADQAARMMRGEEQV